MNFTLFNILLIIVGVLLISFVIFSLVKGRSLQEVKGSMGESMVKGILRNLPDDYFSINDIILKYNNRSTQIDHVVVSKYGVFVIETKNYRGNIYGNDYKEEWKQVILTDVTFGSKWWKVYTYATKSYFYNPVKQNLGHINWIKRILKESSIFPYLPVISIVVFADNADISGVRSESHVVNMRDLLDTILSYDQIYLQEGMSPKLTDLILSKKDDSKENLKSHIQNVEYEKAKKEDCIRYGICPKCGGELRLRNGKFGEFYGCSNYPKCKFTIDS